MRTCTFEGCNRKHHAGGLCNGHHKQSVKGLPLSNFRRPRRSYPDAAARLAERVRRDDLTGCLLFSGALGVDGYGLIRDGGRNSSAHRVAWTVANGPIPPSMFVCHSCDNPPCVEPSHLSLGTNDDNMKDMRAKNRGPTRASNPQARLTLQQVMDIRRRFVPGRNRHIRGNAKELADEYGVAKRTILNAVTNQSHEVERVTAALDDYRRDVAKALRARAEEAVSVGAMTPAAWLCRAADAIERGEMP